MEKLFDIYNIKTDAEKTEKLKKFASILKEYNEVMNLTAVTGEKEMWIKHFLDSALGERYFLKNANCCEIGSGGGFPSIPLRILREDLSFTLIEATGKKCDYLNYAIKELKLKNMKVICGRAEDLAHDADLRETFDAVTARAVARMNTLCEYCMPFVKIGGSFISYKGDDLSEINEAENAVKTLGGKIESVNSFTLPENSGSRNIVIVRKTGVTPLKYPRGNGKERKKPL